MACLIVTNHDCTVCYTAGLEKLKNVNRSISKVNDHLFPVELMESLTGRLGLNICYIRILEEALTRVNGGNFGAHTFIMPLP